MTRAVGEAVLASLHAQSEEGRSSITMDYFAEHPMVIVEDEGQGFSFKKLCRKAPPPQFWGTQEREESAASSTRERFFS